MFKKVRDERDEIEYFSNSSRLNWFGRFNPQPWSMALTIAMFSLAVAVATEFNIYSIYQCTRADTTIATVINQYQYDAELEFPSPSGRAWKESVLYDFFAKAPGQNEQIPVKYYFPNPDAEYFNGAICPVDKNIFLQRPFGINLVFFILSLIGLSYGLRVFIGWLRGEKFIIDV